MRTKYTNSFFVFIILLSTLFGVVDAPPAHAAEVPDRNAAKVYGPSGAVIDGLVAHWSLDSGVNGVFTDTVAGRTLSFDPFQNTDGKLGYAQPIGASNAAAIDITTPITPTIMNFGAWVYFSQTVTSSTDMGIMQNGNSFGTKYGAYTLFYDKGLDKVVFEITNDSDVTYNVASAVTITPQSWHYVFAGYDDTANQIKVSIDGGNFATASFSGNINPAPDRTWAQVPLIAKMYRGDNSDKVLTNGKVDEISFWNRNLDSGELAKLYNEGYGCSYPWATCLPQTNDYLKLVKHDTALATYPNIRGQGMTVAIIDSGIDSSLPKFANKIAYEYDFVNNDNRADDEQGHGTGVANIVVDTCPACRLVVLKVMANDLLDSTRVAVNAPLALSWIHNNYKTYNIVSVNMSLGSPLFGFFNGDPLSNANLLPMQNQLDLLYADGVTVVAAAGNLFYSPYFSQQGVVYPANQNNVIGVGAVFWHDQGAYADGSGAQANTTQADQITPFSNRHPSYSSIFAPGADITVTTSTGFDTFGGTSAATPIVAGAVALIQQKAKLVRKAYYTPDQIRNNLSANGDVIHDIYDSNDNVTNTHLDYKRLNLLKSMQDTRMLGNALQDGDFELNNGYWQPENPQQEFGLITSNPLNTLAFGNAQCGNNFYMLGSYNYPIWRALNGNYTNMHQDFSWQGGAMYYKYSAKGEVNKSKYSSYLLNLDTGVTTTIRSNHQPYVTIPDWVDVTGTITSTVAGNYRLMFDFDQADTSGGFVGIDNVYISDSPSFKRPCDTTGFELFPTNTPGWTPTPAIVSVPDCSFENGGGGWGLTPGTAYIRNDVTPPTGLGSHVLYAYSTAFASADFTDFNTNPSPLQRIYVQFYYKGSPRVWIQSLDQYNNYATVLDFSQRNALPRNETNWTFFQGVIYTGSANGRYRLSLGAAKMYLPDEYNNYSDLNYEASSTAYYDGVMMSFATPPNVYCGNVAPTATPLNNPTRTPTPLSYPTVTKTPFVTRTPGPTITPRFNASGTPLPPKFGEQPDNTTSRPCTEPPDASQYLTWDNWWNFFSVFPAWFSYLECRFYKFFTWNSANTTQFEDLKATATTKEPFATISNVMDAMQLSVVAITRLDFGAEAACPGNLINLIPTGTMGGWFGGGQTLDLTQNAGIDFSCDFSFDFFGVNVSHGICFGYKILCYYGVMQLLRWLVNLGAAFFLYEYISLRWMTQAES